MAGVNWSSVPLLTPGMKNLGNQINRRFPTRSGASDGARGDYAHTQGTSGHNPDDTRYDNAEWDGDSDSTSEIRAIDVDKDLNDPRGASMQELVDYIRRLPGIGTVLRYIIFNKKIYHVRNGFAPEDYEGDNKHTEHVHFSGAWTQASDANTSFDFKLEQLGDRVATQFNAEDRDVLKAEATEGVLSYAGGGLPIWPGKPATANFLNSFTKMFNNIQELQVVLAAVASKVDLDPAELAAITAAVPSAEENAEAVIAALGDAGVDTLADILREGLSPEERAELAAALLA